MKVFRGQIFPSVVKGEKREMEIDSSERNSTLEDLGKRLLEAERDDRVVGYEIRVIKIPLFKQEPGL